MAPPFARARSLWRGARGRDALTREMSEEFQSHIQLRADDLARREGLAPAEAMRRARLEFGSPEHYKDRGAESRGLKPFDDLRISWLDFKLGFRMLSKYPGLTMVGGIAIAFAVAAGAGTFELVRQALHPTLPFDDGDRVVAVRVWDAANNRVESRTLHDFERWRHGVKTIEQLGAFRTQQRNLIGADPARGEPVVVAEISASAFQLTRVRPLLGRALIEADEAATAPPVVVLGYDVWQSRFGGDSSIVGRTVRLGRAPATVVGVMPDGYRFPVYHSAWVPFKLNAVDYAGVSGPAISKVFGRLAPGVTLDQARAELGALGVLPVPGERGTLRVTVFKYAESFLVLSGVESAAVMSVNLFLVMLMLLVCSNVALLMFARAASREGEIVVRTALGASRSRIVMQLFAEAAVLGGVGAAIGLGATSFVLKLALATMAGETFGLIPFWFSNHLSPATLAYAISLTLLGAALAGALPAFKVTRGLESRLRQAAAGAGGLRFGGVWTAVIVAQVAVTVAFPVSAFIMHRSGNQMATLRVGFADDQYLAARVDIDRDVGGGVVIDTTKGAPAGEGRTVTGKLFQSGARGASRPGLAVPIAAELTRRLEDEPGVMGVTFANILPRMDHPQRRIEIDAGFAAPVDSTRGILVSSASVATNYFDVVGAPIRLGRGFHAGDVALTEVVVNESFVKRVLGGRNPIGRHVRYAAIEPNERRNAADDKWFEIIGVVKDLGMTDGGDPGEGAGFYRPLAAGTFPSGLMIHVRGDPAAFAGRLRAVAASVDPALRLDGVVPMNHVADPVLRGLTYVSRALAVVSGIALLLSLAGLYAVMSFAVARRTREIGVRVALGADPRRIVTAIFAQPMRQLGLGIVAGAVLAAWLMISSAYETIKPAELAALAVYAVLMLAVCMLACVVPTRRALRVDPTEALRSD